MLYLCSIIKRDGVRLGLLGKFDEGMPDDMRSKVGVSKLIKTIWLRLAYGG